MLYLLLRKALVLIILASHFVCHAVEFADYKSNADLQVAMYAAVGNTLEAICTITNYKGNRNASHIYFRYGGVNISDAHVEVLSSKKSRLLWKPKSCAPGKYDLLDCCVDDGCPAPGSEVVTIGRPPLDPEITSCVVYNWKTMMCSWKPTYEEQKLHVGKIVNNVRLHWRVSQKDRDYLCNYMGYQKNTCTWKSDGKDGFTADIVYYVQVKIWNDLGNRSSNWTKVNTSTIVRPNPVANLTAVRNMTFTRNLTLRWSSPASSRDLIYRVSYLSQWERDKNSWQIKTVDTPKSINGVVTATLIDLVPYTLYNIQVSAKPRTAGFWSKNSCLSYDVRTQEDVPAKHPDVTAGSFEIKDVGRHRVVTIYWKNVPPPQIYGPVIYYDIVFNITTLTDKGNVLSKRQSHRIQLSGQFMCNITLDANQGAFVKVEASGRRGFHTGRAQRLIIDPKINMPHGVQKLSVISFSKTRVQLSWKKNPENEPKVQSYTVYWCKGSQNDHKCNEELQWAVLPRTNDTYPITLPPGENYQQYLYAISTEYDGNRSSGMIWSPYTCEWSRVSYPPSDLRITYQDHHSLSFRWTDVTKCDPKFFRHLISYNVQWCPLNGQNICADGAKVVIVPGELSGHTLTGLQANTAYRVEIVRVTAHLISKHSLSIVGKTTAYWATGKNIAAVTIPAIICFIFMVVGLVTVVLKMKQCRSRLVSQVEITLPDKIKVDDVIMTNFHNDKTSSVDECKSNAVFKHITSFNRNSNIDDGQGTIFIDVNSSLNNFSLPGDDKNQTPTMCSDCVHNIYSDGVFMEYDTTVQNANSINLSNTQDEFDYTTWNELQIEGNQDSADHDCTYDDMTYSIMRGSGESFCQIDYILKNIHVTKDIGSTEEHDSNTNLKNSINLNQNSNMDSGPSTLPVDENWSPHNFSLPGTDENQVSCYNCENDKNPEDASFVCGTNSINASITPDEFDYVTWNRLQMRRHQGSGDQDCKCHVISSGMKNKTESFHEVDDLLGNDQASESTRFIDEYDNNQYLKNPKSFKQNSSTDSEHGSISICENSSRQNFSLSGTNTSHTKCGECDSDTYSQGVFLEYDATVQNTNSDHTNTLHGVDEFDYISWNKLQMKRRRINSVEETCKHTLQ